MLRVDRQAVITQKLDVGATLQQRVIDHRRVAQATVDPIARARLEREADELAADRRRFVERRFM